MAAQDKKLDFIVCGAQKSGTTALYNYLSEHPQICMPKTKELHFFDDEKIFNSRVIDYSIYHSYFDLKPWHKIAGEITPIYMYWYDAPRRIYEYSSSIKIVLILRNPVERAYSHWNMEILRKNEVMGFEEAVKQERIRCREALPYQHRIYSYVDRGFYMQQINRFLTYFPEQQIHVIKTEDLENNHKQVLKRLYDYLGVKRLISPDVKKVHVLPYSIPMSESARNYLKNIYELEIRNIEKCLGWNCRDWLN